MHSTTIPTNLNADQVLYRYPHYNEDSIQEDLRQLTNIDLLEGNLSSLTVSNSGKDLIRKYWNKKIENAALCDNSDDTQAGILVSISRKLLMEYSKNEDLRSVRIRMKNREQSFDEFPVVLQANEYQKDLTAVFNDIGHYRIDFLLENNTNGKWKELRLSPLAKELLGVTRNQRKYPASKCSTQPNWRVGQEACYEAFSELEEAGLINFENDTLHQTVNGDELFRAADKLSDERLYSAWNALTNEEYEKLLKALEWVSLKNN